MSVSEIDRLVVVSSWPGEFFNSFPAEIDNPSLMHCLYAVGDFLCKLKESLNSSEWQQYVDEVKIGYTHSNIYICRRSKGSVVLSLNKYDCDILLSSVISDRTKFVSAYTKIPQRVVTKFIRLAREYDSG